MAFIRVILLAGSAVCSWFLGLASPVAVAANTYDAVQLHPAIPLLDEAGRHVLQTGQPYSPRMSCGNGSGEGCHDYAKITKGYHFQQGRDEAADDFGAKRGLPQLVSPGYFGGYTCLGANNPLWLARKRNGGASEFGDLGAADAVKRCGNCHAGGGWGERDRNGVRYDEPAPGSIKAFDGDYFSRTAEGQVQPWDWATSGVREADCLHCHVDFGSLTKFPESGVGANDGSDGSDRAIAHYRRLKDDRLLAAGHFRYAASALLEFLNLAPGQPGGLSLLSFQRAILPNTQRPDYRLVTDTLGRPVLRWNPAAFDGSGKVLIPMLRFPGNESCMTCHETSYTRRGFYGFGEAARQHRDDQGVLEPDFRDDVHKGVRFTEDDGESRVIDNCNACHAKEYWKPPFRNVNLSADHHFLKGNGDNDVRNDLDGQPPVKSCEHCHDEVARPALPSGQRTVKDAHQVIWTLHGDMNGYPAETIGRITQAHLDKVACQTCHINRLANPDGSPLRLHYRYRRGHGGKLKIFPYNPAYRFYAADKTSGRVLYQWERDAVLERRDGHGAIVDPNGRSELGRVPLRADGSFGEPDSAAGWKALQTAYNRLLAAKGYDNPRVRFIYVESNDYVISHNTRPATEAVQCGECHAREQSGAFSSLLVDEGLLGAGQEYEVARLPDPRLVTEGVFELGMPAYRLRSDGRIVERVTDVLYSSRLEASMTLLKAESSRTIAGEFKPLTPGEAARFAGLSADSRARIGQQFGGGDWLLFNSAVGHPTIRSFALLVSGNTRNRTLLEDVRAEASSRDPQAADQKPLRKLLWGRPVSPIYTLRVADQARKGIAGFVTDPLIIKLPHRGKTLKSGRLRVAWSDDGSRWRRLLARDVLGYQRGTQAYALIRTRIPHAHWVVMAKGRIDF